MQHAIHCLLGLAHYADHSALVTLVDGHGGPALHSIERFPRRLSEHCYPHLIACRLTQLGRVASATLAIDATGPGRPIVTAIRRAKLPLRLWPIALNGACRDAIFAPADPALARHRDVGAAYALALWARKMHTVTSG